MASKPEIVFRGSGVSSGVVLGQALKLDINNRLILKLHIDDVEEEAARYLRAVEAAKEQMENLKSRLEEKVGSEHSIILDAHLLILEDRTLNAEILATIRNSRANAEWAVAQATDRLIHAYQSLEDEYFRERHSDIEQVAERILLNLTGDRPLGWEHLPNDLIIASRDFSPSNFAAMELQKVRGLALESGGRTSHTAIISRGLRLPAVMGVHNLLASVSTGDVLLIDGDEGRVIVNPTQQRIEKMRRRIDSFHSVSDASSTPSSWTTVTKDGTPVSLRANTELPNELRAAKACGAEGIGLYRSEFLYFGHPHGFPGMEEQLEAYRALIKEMSPHTVSIRTLDAGSEKVYDRADLATQPNPSMGLRGIRLSLHTKDVFRTQIEAILRASREGKIEIVLPMISTVEEIWQARALINEVGSELLKEPGMTLNPVPVGAMIEVPAAVLSLDSLAREVDFLCVGTNDLIQYTLAVDRGNPQVAYLFQPLHPSVLQCLHRISEVAKKLNKPVRICGEISSNPFFAVLLLGMGFTQLSMNPLSIPPIRRVLREVPLEACREIAREVLLAATTNEVHKYLTESVSNLVGWDLKSYANEIAPAQLNGK
jgi:phosphoenolpyruvate-protein phosphotransferase (PTS system enzyme I)